MFRKRKNNAVSLNSREFFNAALIMQHINDPKLNNNVCYYDILQPGYTIVDQIFFSTYLVDINLSNALMKNLKFDRCQLRNANFRNATFENCTFNYVDFSGANFSGAYLHDCLFGTKASYFTRPWTITANFSRVIMDGVRIKANLAKNTSFESATLTNCNFSSIGIYNFESWNVNFEKSKLYNVILLGRKFPNANFSSSSIDHSDFTCTDLTSSYFDSALITSTNFDRSNLLCASFFASQLQHCNFSNLELFGVRIRKADFNNCNFNHTKFNEIYFLDTSIDCSNKFDKIQFYNCNLNNIVLRPILIQQNLEHRINDLENLTDTFKDLNNLSHVKRDKLQFSLWSYHNSNDESISIRSLPMDVFRIIFSFMNLFDNDSYAYKIILTRVYFQGVIDEILAFINNESTVFTEQAEQLKSIATDPKLNSEHKWNTIKKNHRFFETKNKQNLLAVKLTQLKLEDELYNRFANPCTL